LVDRRIFADAPPRALDADIAALGIAAATPKKLAFNEEKTVR
jgi:hypothetical protein